MEELETTAQPCSMAPRRPEAVTAPLLDPVRPKPDRRVLVGVALCSHSYFLVATEGFNTMTVTGS